MVRTTLVIICIIINISYIENVSQINLSNGELSNFYQGVNYTYYYSDVVHLIPTKTDLAISLGFWTEGIHCWSHLYGYEIAKSDYKQRNNAQITVPVSKVSKYLSDYWKCKIKNFYKHKHYTYDVYFRVRIKDIEPPQIILINRLVLDTRREVSSSEVHVTEYKYAENDTVDVACIIQQPNCEVQMYYDYAETFAENFENLTSKNVVGFQVKLQEKHNNSRMICSCTCAGEKTQVDVVFLLQDSFTDTIMNLKISGNTIRGKWTEGGKDLNKIMYLNYAYFQNEDNFIRAECETGIDGIILNLGGHNYLMTDTKIEGKKLITSNFQFNKASKIEFIARNTTNLFIEEKIVIILTPMLLKNNLDGLETAFLLNTLKKCFNHHFLSDSADLSINLPEENVLLEAYTFKDEGSAKMRVTRTYYEFYDGDILPLICYKNNSSLSATLGFDGTKTNGTFLIKNVKLRLIDNNTSIQCILKSWKTEKILGKSLVTFRGKVIPIPIPDPPEIPSDNSFILYLFVIICILFTIIAILVVVLIIYKKKYDRLKKKNTRTHNEDEKRNDQKIDQLANPTVPPNSHQQELIYAVLELQNSKNTPKKPNNDTIYATVVQKTQEQNSSPENIYANQNDMAIYSNTINPDVVNIDPSTNDLEMSKISPTEDNYTEVVPDRKMGVKVVPNDSDYVNSVCNGYAQPSTSKR